MSIIWSFSLLPLLLPLGNIVIFIVNLFSVDSSDPLWLEGSSGGSAWQGTVEMAADSVGRKGEGGSRGCEIAGTPSKNLPIVPLFIKMPSCKPDP